jgi:hypothetical protein
MFLAIYYFGLTARRHITGHLSTSIFFFLKTFVWLSPTNDHEALSTVCIWTHRETVDFQRKCMKFIYTHVWWRDSELLENERTTSKIGKLDIWRLGTISLISPWPSGYLNLTTWCYCYNSKQWGYFYLAFRKEPTLTFRILKFHNLMYFLFCM